MTPPGCSRCRLRDFYWVLNKVHFRKFQLCKIKFTSREINVRRRMWQLQPKCSKHRRKTTTTFLLVPHEVQESSTNNHIHRALKNKGSNKEVGNKWGHAKCNQDYTLLLYMMVHIVGLPKVSQPIFVPKLFIIIIRLALGRC